MTYIKLDNIDDIIKHIYTTCNTNINKYQKCDLCWDVCNMRHTIFKKYDKQVHYLVDNVFVYITIDVYKSMTTEIEDYINNSNLLSDEHKDDICRYIHLQRKSALDALK